MPTILKQPFSPDFGGQPPRMSTEDSVIWFSWYPTLNPKPQRLYFDVGLGNGRPFPAGGDESLRSMFLSNSQKRADVVMEFPDRWRIVELRDSAQSNAVGRLALYRELWKLDPPDRRPLELFLVTNNADPDLQLLTNPALITYIVLPA